MSDKLGLHMNTPPADPSARAGRLKRSALRRIVFDPSGTDTAKVPAAVRRVTAAPNSTFAGMYSSCRLG